MRHPRPSTYGSVHVRCVTTQGGVVTRTGGRPGGEEGRHHVTSRPPGNPPPPGPTVAPDVSGTERDGETRPQEAQAGEPAPARTTGTTWGDVVQFLVALFGVLLVGITPNPPVTFRDWLQIVAGAALTAAMTTAAVRDWVRRSASRALGSGPADRLRDWRLW